MKTCTKCGQTKPMDAFARMAQHSTGRRPDCRVCHNAAQRARHSYHTSPVRVGDRIGRLTIVEEAGVTPRRARLVVARCDCGATGTAEVRALRRGRGIGCACTTRTAIVGYREMHRRLKRDHGRPPCVHCGRPSRDWAYLGTDPDEFTDPATGRAFSVYPEHYAPMCRSCHKRYDYDHGVMIGRERMVHRAA